MEQVKKKENAIRPLQDNVLIATGAKVLGSITIGENSKIGAGSVVLKDVPANSTVVGIPGELWCKMELKLNQDLNHCDLPDPISDQFKELEDEIEQLK